MVMSGFISLSAARTANAGQSGVRRAVHMSVTRPQARCINISSRNTQSIAASLVQKRPSALPLKPLSAQTNWQKLRCYSTEGSAPPSAKVRSGRLSKLEKRSNQRMAHIVPSTLQQPSSVDESPEANLFRTPLYDFHVEHGAKLVPFAGYEMPLTYKWGGQRKNSRGLYHCCHPLMISDSTVKEHEQVRKKAGLFDVSHMVQSV